MIAMIHFFPTCHFIYRRIPPSYFIASGIKVFNSVYHLFKKKSPEVSQRSGQSYYYYVKRSNVFSSDCLFFTRFAIPGASKEINTNTNIFASIHVANREKGSCHITNPLSTESKWSVLTIIDHYYNQLILTEYCKYTTCLFSQLSFSLVL